VTPVIGVLALQGDAAEHLRALTAAGVQAVPVRRPGELNAVDGLVIQPTPAHRDRDISHTRPLHPDRSPARPTAYQQYAGDLRSPHNDLFCVPQLADTGHLEADH